MRRKVLLFCPSLKMLFKYQFTDRVSMLTCTLTVSSLSLILSSFCPLCVCAGWRVAMWKGGWALSSTGSRPSRRRRDSLTWATRLMTPPPPPPLLPHPSPPPWSLLLSLCLLLQLLLCVGQFFGTTAEAEEEWRQYKSGAKKGRERSLQVTGHFNWLLMTPVF